VVGEPILMGGAVHDDDERRITRLENSNFDYDQNSNRLGRNR